MMGNRDEGMLGGGERETEVMWCLGGRRRGRQWWRERRRKGWRDREEVREGVGHLSSGESAVWPGRENSPLADKLHVHAPHCAHAHTWMHTYQKHTNGLYTYFKYVVNSRLFKYTPGFCQICRKWLKHDAGCYKRHFNFFICTLSEHAYVQKATTHILHTMCTQSPGFPDARGEGSANSIACQHNLLS